MLNVLVYPDMMKLIQLTKSDQCPTMEPKRGLLKQQLKKDMHWRKVNGFYNDEVYIQVKTQKLEKAMQLLLIATGLIINEFS